ncbi:MAG: hypothetical protein U9Q82_08875 [Chloroflexota bacterium]|nr:hypothetical protein [Chloroflexota bacterium]
MVLYLVVTDTGYSVESLEGQSIPARFDDDAHKVKVKVNGEQLVGHVYVGPGLVVVFEEEV